MEYLIPFVLAGIGIYKNNQWTTSKRKVFIGVILVYVILLLGFRYRVGMDTIGYMKSFDKARDLAHFWTLRIFRERHEPGYLFVCAICKSISKEFWVLQLVMASITNSCIFIFLYRYCRNVFVGIIIFFILQWLYFSTEIMREGVAIGIFLLNYKNIEDRKWIRFYLLSLVSISFHYSAIIIWLFPFVKYLKFNIWYILICIGILAITPMIIKIGEILSFETITDRIDKYVGKNFNYNLNWKIGEFIKAAFPAIIALAVGRLFKIHQYFKSILLLQILLCIGAFAIPIIFSRFANYSSIFVTVSFANILCIKYLKPWLKTILVCMLLTTQSYYYYKMYPAWVPYVSIFDQKYIRERELLWRSYFT